MLYLPNYLKTLLTPYLIHLLWSVDFVKFILKMNFLLHLYEVILFIFILTE